MLRIRVFSSDPDPDIWPLCCPEIRAQIRLYSAAGFEFCVADPYPVGIMVGSGSGGCFEGFDPRPVFKGLYLDPA